MATSTDPASWANDRIRPATGEPTMTFDQLVAELDQLLAERRKRQANGHALTEQPARQLAEPETDHDRSDTDRD